MVTKHNRKAGQLSRIWGRGEPTVEVDPLSGHSRNCAIQRVRDRSLLRLRCWGQGHYLSLRGHRGGHFPGNPRCNPSSWRRKATDTYKNPAKTGGTAESESHWNHICLTILTIATAALGPVDI